MSQNGLSNSALSARNSQILLKPQGRFVMTYVTKDIASAPQNMTTPAIEVMRSLAYSKTPGTQPVRRERNTGRIHSTIMETTSQK
jgi:hypothetical protein